MMDITLSPALKSRQDGSGTDRYWWFTIIWPLNLLFYNLGVNQPYAVKIQAVIFKTGLKIFPFVSAVKRNVLRRYESRPTFV